MQKICSLYSNSWQKKTRSTEDKLHILCPEAAGDSENDLHQDAIASLATDGLTWRNFVVACSAANDNDDDNCTNSVHRHEQITNKQDD